MMSSKSRMQLNTALILKITVRKHIVITKLPDVVVELCVRSLRLLATKNMCKMWKRVAVPMRTNAIAIFVLNLCLDGVMPTIAKLLRTVSKSFILMNFEKSGNLLNKILPDIRKRATKTL